MRHHVKRKVETKIANEAKWILIDAFRSIFRGNSRELQRAAKRSPAETRDFRQISALSSEVREKRRLHRLASISKSIGFVYRELNNWLCMRKIVVVVVVVTAAAFASDADFLEAETRSHSATSQRRGLSSCRRPHSLIHTSSYFRSLEAISGLSRGVETL